MEFIIILLVWFTFFIIALVHELGHFVFFKLFNIEVKYFVLTSVLNFLPKFTFKNSFTEFIISPIAIGGFVLGKVKNISTYKYLTITAGGFLFNLISIFLLFLFFSDGIKINITFITQFLNYLYDTDYYKIINEINKWGFKEFLYFEVNLFIYITILMILSNILPIPGSDGYELITKSCNFNQNKTEFESQESIDRFLSSLIRDQKKEKIKYKEYLNSIL